MNCRFCDTPLHRDDAGTWVDDTDGDCCWGDDDLRNENQAHVPGGVNHPENTVTITVCLACADGDHHVCYGTNCRCYCGGELV